MSILFTKYLLKIFKYATLYKVTKGEAMEAVKNQATSTELEYAEQLAIANIIIDGACHMHSKSHASNLLTESYLQFYFNEIQTYTPLFDSYLTYFFQKYKPSNVNIYMEVYAHAPRTLGITYKKRKHDSKLTYIKPYTLPLLNYNFGTDEKNKTITRIQNIIKHFNADKEIISFEERYETYQRNQLFLAKRTLAEKRATERYLEAQDIPVTNSTTPQEKTRPVPTRSILHKAPKQKRENRVARLIIPEIVVMGDYPTDQTSRVDLHYHPKAYKSPENTLRFVNRWGFQTAKITTNFFRKHKSMHRKKRLLSLRPY